jgi:hypothetical protein
MIIDEIRRQYPRLREANVYDALAYASDDPGEIEADLPADDEDAAKGRLSGNNSSV